jgi:hypothetical protein
MTDPCLYDSQEDCGKCQAPPADAKSRCHAICKTRASRCLRQGLSFPSTLTLLDELKLCWQHELYRLRDYKSGDLVYGMEQSRQLYSIFTTGAAVPFVTVDMYTKAIQDAEAHDIKTKANGTQFRDFVRERSPSMLDPAVFSVFDDREWTQQMCRLGIDFIMTRATNNHIHFVLDSLDLNFRGSYSHTLNELRHIKSSYRQEYNGRILFYIHGRRCVAPDWDQISAAPQTKRPDRAPLMRNKRSKTDDDDGDDGDDDTARELFF